MGRPSSERKSPTLSAIRRVAGLVIVACFVLAAILAPLITSHDPAAGNLPDRNAPPFWQDGGSLSNPLGTDRVGRDVWSRLVHGARTSLIISLGALAIGGGLGTALGFASGYWRGPRDWIFDFTLPRLISPAVWLVGCVWIAVVLVASVGPSLIGLTIVLGLVTWPRYLKPVRREVMRPDTPGLGSSVDQGSGTPDFRPPFSGLIPRVVGALPALLVSQMAFLIILESVSSFLGLGAGPLTPSWGRMIADTRNDLTNWWIWAPPALSILLVVTSFYTLGSWLRDRPRNSRAAA